MATKAQKHFRKEMKKARKENKEYFDNLDIYNKRTSSLKRKAVRNVAYAGGGIIVIRILLFLVVYILPKLIPASSQWFGNAMVDDYNQYTGFEYDNYDYEGKYMSLEEQVSVLAELGITGVKEDMLNEIREFYQLYNLGSIDRFISVLGAIGYGDYDYDTGLWTPVSNKVYGFDTEVFNTEVMYSDFLNGIIAISDNEFQITNIYENLDDVDYDKGKGRQIISFDYNGHPYQFKGKVNNDWIDCRVIDFFNDILEKENNPKRLWCMFDGGQGYFLFYNTVEWADEFTEKTLIPLSLSYK